MSKPPNTLTPTECSQLLNFFCNNRNIATLDQKRMRNYAMVVLMLDAGLRVGELVQLRLSDLIAEHKAVTTLVLRAEITKTKVERLIPCTQRIIETAETVFENLYEWSDVTGEKYAFRKPHSFKPITVRTVQLLIKKCSKMAIGRKITPHTLRHTFATRLMQKTNIRVVQRLLGHKSITSTQVYTHPNHEDLSGAIKAIEQ